GSSEPLPPHSSQLVARLRADQLGLFSGVDPLGPALGGDGAQPDRAAGERAARRREIVERDAAAGGWRGGRRWRRRLQDIVIVGPGPRRGEVELDDATRRGGARVV